MAEASSLELADVDLRYGSNHLLRHASAVFAPGKIHLLMGPNGVGKTTLVRCVLGQERCTGSITYGGALLKTGSRLVHVAFEDSPAHRTLTGRQNLSLYSRADAAPVDRYLTPSLLGRRVKKYSYGERKKLAITVAVASTSPVVILDEPTNGLDREALKLLADDLGSLAAERVVIVVGHDLSFMGPLVDEVHFFDHGSLEHVSMDHNSPDTSLESLYESAYPPVVDRDEVPALQPHGRGYHRGDAPR